MSDTDFLYWLLARLTNVYGESPNTDFVRRLQSLVESLEAA